MASKDLPSIEGEVSLNYDEDKKEFTEKPRQVTIYSSIDEDGQSKVTISFELGRKEDDDFALTFDSEEFMQKIVRAIAFGEDYRK